jgi:hypothetical protein
VVSINDQNFEKKKNFYHEKIGKKKKKKKNETKKRSDELLPGRLDYAALFLCMHLLMVCM